MRYLSICSGIEAATQAWRPLGWSAVAFAEIEKFPCAVLAHHYGSNLLGEPLSSNAPPNLGDITNHEEWPELSVDVIVGGTPCQDYSVAGKRLGMVGARGSLTLSFIQILAKYRPKWFVFENVPGLLSSNEGRDFARFLGDVSGQKIDKPEGGWKNSGIIPGEPLAYGLAYRVLDAQYVRTCEHVGAVPQRRRRVFVVGCLGDWRRAAAVLFDAESLQGNPPPRREAGQGFAADVAPSLVSSGRGDERAGDTRGQDPVVAARMTAFGEYEDDGTASTLKERDYKDATDLVAHTLKGEGFDASEDGTGRGTPLVPVAFDCKGSQVQTDTSGVSPPLRSMSHNESHANAGGHAVVAFAQNTRDEVRLMGGDGSISGKRAADPGAKQQSYVAFDLRGRDEGAQVESVGETVSLRAAEGGSSRSYVASEWAVRRLTPTECERLQAFPDGFTQIPWRGKPADQCPDGPRYKALGNSMAVNCMRWIGERIEIVEKLS